MIGRPAPRWVVVVACVALATACSAPERSPLAFAAISTDAPAYGAAFEAVRDARVATLVARTDRVAGGETRDDAIDLLTLSGGADWEAFGAGYLAQCSELGDDAAMAMPEFDVIGGISTGALIATCIVAQTPARYGGIEGF